MMGAPGSARVLFVANAAKIGGGNRVLMDLIARLDRSRYQPLLVSPEQGPLTEWAQDQGLSHFICRGGDWQGSAGLARRSARLLELILRTRASVVHAAAPTCYRSLGIAGGIARVARVCHLGFPPEQGEIERSFLWGPEAVVGCYEGQALQLADRIRRVRPGCRVRGIPNGVDTDRFAPAQYAELTEEAKDLRAGADRVVAILGHISDVKGYPTFIEAAAQISAAHPRTRFVAIGGETVQHGYRRVLEERVQALGLQHAFRFLGFRNDVAPLLQAVDIVTLPSLSEGFPLAVLEAMACGKPVIATPVGGVPEAVTDGVNGLLVPPGRSDALAAAAIGLLNDSSVLARMSREARRRAELHYSARLFAERVQALYDELLRVRKPSLSN